jgi:hypothetical protein
MKLVKTYRRFDWKFYNRIYDHNVQYLILVYAPVAQLGEPEDEKDTKCVFFPVSARPWKAGLGFLDFSNVSPGMAKKSFQVMRP